MEEAKLNELPVGSSIAIAVSGGPDSMALCLLTHQWAKPRGIHVFALTVDHGLRPESRQEAKRVQDWLEKIGMVHETLRRPWEVPSQTGHIQEAARKHRYALLYEKCKREGIDNLLTAHQLEDQVETFIMRLSHSSGVDGLACIQKRHAIFFPPMPPGAGTAHSAMVSTCLAPPLHPPLTTLRMTEPSRASYPAPLYIVRPLLEVSKDRLIATCEKFGQESVDDPTNQNMNFHRNRIRQALPALWDAIGRDELSRTIYHFQKARNQMHQKVNEIMQKHAVLTPRPSVSRSNGGPFRSSPQHFAGHLYLPISLFVDHGERAGLSLPLSMRVLQAALVSVGGLRAERLSLKLQALREITERMRATATYAAYNKVITLRRNPAPILPAPLKASFTACGCLVQLYLDRGVPTFLVHPERRMATASEPIQPGETLLWENRLAISFDFNSKKMSQKEKAPQRSYASWSTSRHADAGAQGREGRYFVRRLQPNDYKWSAQLVEAAKEVPADVRTAMPVLVDDRDRVLAMPTVGFYARDDLEVSTAPVFPLTSEPSPYSMPDPTTSMTTQQKFDLFLDQLGKFADLHDHRPS